MKKVESSAYKTYDAETTVQLLGRLKSDCDYVLKFGGMRNLWGKTIDGHIGAMRFYLDSLEDKPSWLTHHDIDDYERKLKDRFSESVTEMEEVARHLVKLEVFFDGHNAYSFNYEGKVKVFRGDETALAKFLQSFKAKDNKTQPRSVRGERYADIAKEIIDGTDTIIYAWSNDLMNAFNKHESVKEAFNANRAEVFVFSDQKAKDEFVKFLNRSDADFQISGNKVLIDTHFMLQHMDDVANFLDAHIDGVVIYSPDEYAMLKRRGVKIESISDLKESIDEIILDSASFKANGLYDKVASTYNRSWADWLASFADDRECQKVGFKLMTDQDFKTLNITKSGDFKNWILFFSDKTGSKDGDFIKLVPNGLFSKQFAASRKITFIGLEDGELVIKSNDAYLCIMEEKPYNFSRIEESAYDTVFLFYDSEAQELFTYYLKEAKVKFDMVMNKISVDYKKATDIPKLLDLIDRYSDEIVSYSTKEYADLMKKGLLEAVNFTRDGVQIDNSDGALLTHLFNELEGDPRWKVDKDHRRCTRNDGHYFCIKGNMLEAGNRTSVFITIPWTKEISFMLLPTADIVVRFEINAAGPGRFMI